MPTFTLIMPAVVVGSGGAASIDFTAIPSTYTDLVVKYSLRSTANDSGGSTPIDVRLRLNGSAAAIYSERMIYGTGSSALSAATSGTLINWTGTQTNNSQTVNTFSSNDLYIPNYAGSSNKSLSVDGVQENNATAAASRLTAGLWASTAAITSLTLTPDYGNFAQYSTAYLYGVSNA